MTPTTPSVVEDSMGVPIVEATSNDDEKSLWIPQQELEKDDDDDDDNTLAETDETGGKAVSEDMPLWYYQRIEPPPPPKNDGIKTTTVAVVYRTAMVLGKVVLNETTTIPLSSSSSTPRIAAIAPSDDIATPMPHPGQEIPIHPQWTNAPVYIVVSGYSDGSVTIVEASTGRNVLPTTPGSNAGINNSNTNSTTPRDETNQKTDFACLWMGGDDRSNHSSNTTATSSAIVAVSVDSSGTVIAAMDAAGNVSVWTVQYQLLYRPDESSSMGSTITTTDTTTATGVAPERAQQQAASIAAAAAVEAGGGGNLFAKLFWNRSPMSPPPPSSATIPPTTESTTQESSTSATAAANNSQYLVPTLTMVMCEPHFKVQRLAYSKADFGGTPTCFCLDPAYKAPPQSSFVSSNNNNKSASLQQQQQQQLQQQMIVAFDTGKIVLSGRSGGTWRMRLDHITLPYTGPPIHDPDWRGIETMVWRGNLLAFADCSGVKLFDTLTLAPVAHVDRPIGARPSLYPSTQFQVSPHLCFETSRQLLVAWGDCLLTLTVSNALTGTSDTAASTTSIASGTAPLTTSNSSLTATDQSSSSIALRKQRSVSCTMAWGLDCIAAGVVPIDARHVAILGRRIDLLRDDHAGNEGDEEDDGVELQVLDRSNGFVVYSDLLQLEQLPETYQGIEPKESKVRALSERYALLSTFAVPRMGDAAESKLDSFDSTSFRESKRSFVDEHVQWSMENVSFSFADDRSGLEDDDANSVDSDDYSFFVRSSDNLKTMAELSADVSTLAPSPFLVVASATDSVSARMRNVDDAINFALRQKKCALALRLALPFIRQLRCHKINDLVHSYLRAVLRLVDADGTMGIVSTRNEEVKRRRHLSLRRMKLAAEMLPILLGGNSEMWETWISELEQIPGALFVVRSTLPVRDPKLPKHVYTRVLCKMLVEVESMRISAKSDSLRRLADEGDGHFVNALLAWGTTRALKEHISLFEYQNARTLSSEFLVQFATESLNLRFEQTAVPYLNLSAITSSPVVPSEPQQQSIKREVQDKEDSLYDIDELISFVSQRATSIDFDKLHRKGHVQIDYTGIRNGRVALDSLARLLMMGNFYDDALKCFLVLGATHATQTLDEIENEAISAINDTATAQPKQIFPFCFVLHLIENFHLHECLFDTSFFPSNVNCSQVCALVRLVGLQLAGEFLIENCVAPQKMSGTSSTDNSSGRQESSQHAVSVKERRGTLPLDMVAEQLSGSPKLLHWYLHLVFSRKPELYVKFPTTANPPSVITNLHKKHLDLYIKYTGKNRDSSQALAGVEAYRVVEHTTPLLAFLKVVLQIGAIGPAEVGKILEKERRGSAGVSRILALELAYMMENFGDGSESDAQLILELYLKGTQSIMLAVSFTQRAHDYFGKLWETLIEYCLSNSSVAEESTQDKTSLKSGALFGSLLEAAAHCGADLAHLVSQIPPGMQVEGLRPRMVAAVADYRLKVELHSISTDIAIAEKVLLYQEMSRRSHRGMRSDGLLEESVVSVAADSAEIITVGCESPNTRNTDEIVLTVLSPTLRTRYRPSRYHHSFSIAIR